MVELTETNKSTTSIRNFKHNVKLT